jgi:signal transduction histidine kinase
MERRIRTTLWTIATLAGLTIGVPGGLALGLLIRDRQPLIAVVCLMIAGSAAVILARTVKQRSDQLIRPFSMLARAADEVDAGRLLPHPVPTGDPNIDRVASVLATASVELAQRTAAREERQRAFANDLSNQLRGPVTNLRLVIESAERNSESSPLLTAAHVELDRLQVTVDHLLMLTRDRQPAAGSIALSSIANGAERRWSGVAAAAGRQMNITADRSLPNVCGSKADVDQIIDALVENAIHHGGGHIFITTRVIQGGAALDVADQGPGIAHDQTDRVFFHRRVEADEQSAESESPSRSTTIGLAAAKALAEANGGRLVLSSARPPRFSLILPATS